MNPSSVIVEKSFSEMVGSLEPYREISTGMKIPLSVEGPSSRVAGTSGVLSEDKHR